MTETIVISPAQGAADIAAARDLFLAYARSLDFSLCFQDFDAELAELPGKYAPPKGAILLARRGHDALGVVALRDLGEGIAEMKRLYVAPKGRGHDLGRRLAEAVIAEARRLGYRAMRLDSLHRMVAANKLYDSLNFKDIEPYCENPLPDARYRELIL